MLILTVVGRVCVCVCVLRVQASSLMGSMPATPATPGTAHTDTWDVRSAGGSAASSSRPLTGVTEPPASREGAATGPAGMVGRGGIGEEAQVEAVHSTGGGVVEPKPPPPDDMKEVRALTKEIFGMADADNDAYVSQVRRFLAAIECAMPKAFHARARVDARRSSMRLSAS
eukprot:COSAG01_NODE_1714_length_9405_cov_6.727488_11_plen_171_part_00